MTELTGPRSSPDSPSKTFESPLSDLSPAVKGPKVATRCVAGLPDQADDRQDQADGQHGGAGDHEPLGVPHGRGDQPAAGPGGDLHLRAGAQHSHLPLVTEGVVPLSELSRRPKTSTSTPVASPAPVICGS